MSEPNKMRAEIGDDVIYQTVDDEFILLNMKAGQYYGLNKIGGEVWKRLLSHQNTDVVAEMSNEICAKYETDEATARRDIEKLIADLRKLELLKV